MQSKAAKRGLNRGGGASVDLERFAAMLQALPAEDKADLFDLFVALPTFIADPEAADAAGLAIRQIVERTREDVTPVPALKGSRGKRPAKLQKWVGWISGEVQRLRNERGWTQEILAAKSGLPQSHISRIEGGRLSPSRKTVEKLAKALRVPLSTLDPSAD